MNNGPLNFSLILVVLQNEYGVAAAPTIVDPFEQILLENIAYLAEDDRRLSAFRTLQERVGLSPQNILSANPDELADICKIGGMVPDLRAERLIFTAELTVNNFEGTLSKVVNLPRKEALKELQKFPVIGLPSAEKILLFAGIGSGIAPDSNILRVLFRLGVATETGNYSRDYKNMTTAIEELLPSEREIRIELHQQLRRLGKQVCRRCVPQCTSCPLVNHCETGANKMARE